MPDEALILQEGESDLGKGQSRQSQVMLDLGALGLLAAQKFPAGRQIVEQLPHLHAGARSMTGGLDFQNFSAVNDDLRGLRGIAVAFASRQREPADTGDARQGFAAKTHGRNGRKVFGFPDFAGRVPFQAEQRIVLAHADAVVRDADQAASAGLNFHGDSAGLRVQRVFDEFLDHAGGTLDHFSGSNLVGDLFRQ